MKKLFILFFGLLLFTQNSFGFRLQNRSGYNGVILYIGREYNESQLIFERNSTRSFHTKKFGIWFDFSEKSYLFEFNLSCRGIDDSSEGTFRMKRIIERGQFCGYEGVLDIGGYTFSSDGIIQN